MTIYYVHPGGSDNSPGDGPLPADAWKTIQHGVDTIEPGDTLFVQPGVYQETIVITSPGTSQQPKHLARNGDAWLDGTFVLPGGAFVAGSDTSAPTHTNGSQTGAGYTDNALLTVSASHWTVDMNIRNSRGHGMEIKYDGAALTNITMTGRAEDCRGSGIRIIGDPASNLNVRTISADVEVTGCGNFFPFARDWVDMPWVPAADFRHYDGLSIGGRGPYKNWGEGIAINGGDTHLSIGGMGKQFYDNYNANIKLSRASFLTIEACQMYWSNDPTFMHNGTTGGYAILFDMDGPGTGITEEVYIFHNLFAGQFGSLFHFAGNATPSDLIQIFNNSGYFNGPNGAYSMDGTFDSSYNNVRLRNNVFFSVSGTADTISGNPTNIDSDYNNWATLTPSASLVGANDASGDPLFNEPEWDLVPGQVWPGSDYRIDPASPLVGEADSIYAPAKDLSGIDRGIPSDIGAFEAEGSAAPVMVPPSAQSSLTGFFTSVQFNATEPQGEPITWLASGLPPGISLDPNSGIASGIPSQSGEYSVTIRAEDPGGAFDDEGFIWTVTGASIDYGVYFSAEANDLTVTFDTIVPDLGSASYDIEYGDGFSGNGVSSLELSFLHTYAAPGLYLVKLAVTFPATGAVAKRQRWVRVGGEVRTYQS